MRSPTGRKKCIQFTFTVLQNNNAFCTFSIIFLNCCYLQVCNLQIDLIYKRKFLTNVFLPFIYSSTKLYFLHYSESRVLKQNYGLKNQSLTFFHHNHQHRYYRGTYHFLIRTANNLDPISFYWHLIFFFR